MDQIRILYIEDDDLQRRTLTKELRSRGFKVTVAKSGQTGLDLFQARTFDTILCDLHMTPFSGLDILDRIRKKEPELPFFILTGHGDIPLAVKAIKKGANHFILKPPEINELDITIRQTLEHALVQKRLKESEETLQQRMKDYSASLESKNKEMEHVLQDLSRKSEELQAIIDSSMDVIFLVDNVGTVQAINSRVSDLFGVSPDEIINKGFDKFTRRIKGSFDDFENFRRKIEELKRQPDCTALCADQVNLTLFLERSFVVSSHRQAILAPFSMSVHDENGRETGRVWIYADISLMKRADEQLHTLVTASPTPTIISRVDDGKILYVNRKLADLIGQSPGELVGQKTPDYYHNPEDRKVIIEHLRRDGFIYNYEARIKRADSSLVWMFISVVITEVGGEKVMLGNLHDISERKEAEEKMREILRDLEEANKNLTDAQSQLIQSEKMASLGTLVAGIAHEINTPIGAVRSMHDTLFRTLEKLKEELKLRFPEEDEAFSSLETVLKVIDDAKSVITPGTERVINIVKRLRSFARLDEAHLKTADLHEGLEDTLTLIHHELKRDITVIREYGDIPPITCYPGQLNQVFLNILINARQAIKDKGKITIRTFLKKQTVHIAIEDDGVGIAENKLQKVFDPGFTTKGVGVGTGLGLSISYKIIQDHRGEIKVESEVGKGTTFTVLLPTNLDELLH